MSPSNFPYVFHFLRCVGFSLFALIHWIFSGSFSIDLFQEVQQIQRSEDYRSGFEVSLPSGCGGGPQWTPQQSSPFNKPKRAGGTPRLPQEATSSVGFEPLGHFVFCFLPRSALLAGRKSQDKWRSHHNVGQNHIHLLSQSPVCGSFEWLGFSVRIQDITRFNNKYERNHITTSWV